MKTSHIITVVGFLVILISSCKVKSLLLKTEDVSFNYFQTSVELDTVDCSAVISILNTGKDTLYYPDTLIYSLSPASKDNDSIGIFIDNFVGGHPPPYDIVVKMLLPGETAILKCPECPDAREELEIEGLNIRFFWVTISSMNKTINTAKMVSPNSLLEDRLFFESLRLRSTCIYRFTKSGITAHKSQEMW
jgi:hypothetical protein